MGIIASTLHGAAAGAAGTTALNAATYLDMAGRGRPSSSAPEDAIKTMADRADVRIPGDEETRENRVSGLGALNGIAVGVGVGAAFGALHRLGLRPRRLSGGVLTGLGVMALTDGTMAALGVTDPRQWSSVDWASDVLPHLAYGLVTAATLDALQS